MSQAFDSYDLSYGRTVENSIGFTGLPHDFFLRAKVNVIAAEADRRFGDARLQALDVGCGVGLLHPWLKVRFPGLHGTDLSETCLAQARAKNPEVVYAACTPERLPYGDGAFDLLTASCVLHHVPVAERGGFAGELHRTMRPGGLVAIVEHNPFNPLTQLSVLRCPFDEDAVLLKSGSVERLLRQVGFREVRSEHFLLLPWEREAARTVERAFRRVPLGAQYVTFGVA